MGTGNNFRELKRGGRLVSEVHFIGGTVAQVGNVDYFDDAGNLTLRQIYDLRGFLAVNQYYGRAGELFTNAISARTAPFTWSATTSSQPKTHRSTRSTS